MADGPSVAAEVGHLFRTKRVSEIRQIESSVRSDAEERAGNLRSLLGTRYKELLRAADAVLSARDASQNDVQNSLSGLARNANSLRAEFLKHSTASGSRVRATPAVSAGRDAAEADLIRRRETSALGARLLHIVDSPEVLYACLEGGRVEEATVRFSASEAARAQLDSNVAPAFVQNRWHRVEAFRPQIVAAAGERVESQGLEADEYAGAFIALAVLSDESNRLKTALDSFLRARTQWVSAILDGEPESSARTVSTRLKSLASVVHDTVACCGQLFFGEAPLVFAKLSPFDSKAASGIEELRANGTIVTLLKEWLEASEEVIRSRGSAIVVNAASGRELAGALDAVHAVFGGSASWKQACEESLDIDPGRGPSMFRPIVAERADRIAAACIQSACEEALSGIDTAFGEISDTTDVGDILWSSVATHGVRWESRSRTSSDSKGGRARNDLTRELVRTGSTVSIVTKLERAVGDGLLDVGCLLKHIPEVAGSLREAVSHFLPSVAHSLRDKATILVEEASGRASSAYAGKVEDSTSLGLSLAPSVERALFAARTATAISSAQHIPEAFSYGSLHESNATDAKQNSSVSGFVSFSETAHEASERAYEAWAAILCFQYELQLHRELPSVFALEFHCPWGRPTRAKRPESGAESKTSGDLSIAGAGGFDEHPPCPTAPSAATLRFVLSGCEAANSAGGLALPNSAIRALTSALEACAVKVFSDILMTFKDQLKESSSESGAKRSRLVARRPENVILQLLFDVRFVSGLLTGNSAPLAKSHVGGSSPQTKLVSLISSLVAEIDPINLTSTRKVFDDAVESYLVRSSSLVGTLARTEGRSDSLRQRTSSAPNAFAGVNVVALADPVQRFPYLPAPMPSTYAGRSGLTAGLGAKAAELLQPDTSS